MTPVNISFLIVILVQLIFIASFSFRYGYWKQMAKFRMSKKAFEEAEKQNSRFFSFLPKD